MSRIQSFLPFLARWGSLLVCLAILRGLVRMEEKYGHAIERPEWWLGALAAAFFLGLTAKLIAQDTKEESEANTPDAR